MPKKFLKKHYKKKKYYKKTPLYKTPLGFMGKSTKLKIELHYNVIYSSFSGGATDGFYAFIANSGVGVNRSMPFNTLTSTYESVNANRLFVAMSQGFAYVKLTGVACSFNAATVFTTVGNSNNLPPFHIMPAPYELPNDTTVKAHPNPGFITRNSCALGCAPGISVNGGCPVSRYWKLPKGGFAPSNYVNEFGIQTQPLLVGNSWIPTFYAYVVGGSNTSYGIVVGGNWYIQSDSLTYASANSTCIVGVATFTYYLSFCQPFGGFTSDVALKVDSKKEINLTKMMEEDVIIV